MQIIENEFVPQPVQGETYLGYCDRLEKAVITITALKVPSKTAIEALAFIAMEAPADFNHSSISEIPPYRRIQLYLGQLPSELRALFRAEAIKLPRGREDRVSTLLTIS